MVFVGAIVVGGEVSTTAGAVVAGEVVGAGVVSLACEVGTVVAVVVVGACVVGVLAPVSLALGPT